MATKTVNLDKMSMEEKRKLAETLSQEVKEHSAKSIQAAYKECIEVLDKYELAPKDFWGQYLRNKKEQAKEVMPEAAE